MVKLEWTRRAIVVMYICIQLCFFIVVAYCVCVGEPRKYQIPTKAFRISNLDSSDFREKTERSFFFIRLLILCKCVISSNKYFKMFKDLHWRKLCWHVDFYSGIYTLPRITFDSHYEIISVCSTWNSLWHACFIASPCVT